MFPPGRARLSTKPSPYRIATAVMTMGIVLVAFFAARIASSLRRHDDIHLETDQFGREVGKPFEFRRPYIVTQ